MVPAKAGPVFDGPLDGMSALCDYANI